MKKFLIGLCLFIILIVVVEIFSYIIFRKVIEEDERPFKEILSDNKYFLPEKYDLKRIKRNFRTQKGDPKKGEIVFLGSWSLWNSGIKRQDTLPYMVYKMTNRTVYRFSDDRFGMNNIYSLFADNFVKDNVKNPEYIIYMFSYGDVDNIFRYQLSPNITFMNKRYKITDGEYLQEIKNHFTIFNSLYFVKCMENILEEMKKKGDTREYLLVCLEQIKNKVQEDYPVKTPKLVFVSLFDELNMEEKEIIEDLDYEFIELQNTISEDDFPNAKANEKLAKFLVKKLNL